MKIGNVIITPTFISFKISKFKAFEYQLELDKFYEKTDIYFYRSKKTDHAGIELIFSIKKLFWVMFNIYDIRHWDYDNDCWINHEKCQKLKLVESNNLDE